MADSKSDPDSELSLFLQQAYSAPKPDANFVAELGSRLEQELLRAHRARIRKIRSAALLVVGVCGCLAGYYLSVRAAPDTPLGPQGREGQHLEAPPPVRPPAPTSDDPRPRVTPVPDSQAPEIPVVK